MVYLRLWDPYGLRMHGQYLVEYDPTRPGVSPEGISLHAHVVVTPYSKEAKRFASVKEALEYWRTSFGVRWDGEPNRPLTFFNVEVLGD